MSFYIEYVNSCQAHYLDSHFIYAAFIWILKWQITVKQQIKYILPSCSCIFESQMWEKHQRCKNYEMYLHYILSNHYFAHTWWSYNYWVTGWVGFEEIIIEGKINKLFHVQFTRIISFLPSPITNWIHASFLTHLYIL